MTGERMDKEEAFEGWWKKWQCIDIRAPKSFTERAFLADAKAYRPMVKYDEQEHSSNFGFTIKAYRQGKR